MNIVELALSDIKPYENNPRYNDEAATYVAESIDRFGFKIPIIVDKDYVIIAGHTRYKAAHILGLVTVPCIIADDLDEKQVKAYRIADNRMAELSEWNFDKYNEEVQKMLNSGMLDDIELLDVAGDPFDFDKVRAGELTPMFFGSAMTNFGVKPFLEKFLELAPSPAPRQAVEEMVQPTSEDFSALVFKIQANMDPNHHDRIVFMRICSGKFEKGMSVLHRQSNKTIRLSQPQQFLATERTIVEDAYPGDIIGVFDAGTMGVGDTLCAQKHKITFGDFPVFPPEFFARVSPKDTMKRKQFQKGMTQLAQEGAVQIFEQSGALDSFVVGAVGMLQFEVLEYRLKNEYGVDLLNHTLPYSVARWIDGDVDTSTLKGLDNAMIVKDNRDRTVVLIANEWQMGWVQERNPDVTFLTTPKLHNEI